MATAAVSAGDLGDVDAAGIQGYEGEQAPVLAAIHIAVDQGVAQFLPTDTHFTAAALVNCQRAVAVENYGEAVLFHLAADLFEPGITQHPTAFDQRGDELWIVIQQWNPQGVIGWRGVFLVKALVERAGVGLGPAPDIAVAHQNDSPGERLIRKEAAPGEHAGGFREVADAGPAL